jgi:hypothetical protein
MNIVELLANADAGSYVRTGNPDDKKDKVATNKGFNLASNVKSGVETLDWEDLYHIINSTNSMKVYA